MIRKKIHIERIIILRELHRKEKHRVRTGHIFFSTLVVARTEKTAIFFLSSSTDINKPTRGGEGTVAIRGGRTTAFIHYFKCSRYEKVASLRFHFSRFHQFPITLVMLVSILKQLIILHIQRKQEINEPERYMLRN